jgi:uncharacterized membrane protein
MPVLYLSYVLAAGAIVLMGANVYLAYRLKRSISGGVVGERWGALTLLVSLFFCGYVLSPLALLLNVPSEYLALLMFGVFLGGALFVFVVIGIIRDALTFLKLLN